MDPLEWDFFIAHANADLPVAEKLYDQLSSRARVFLDSRSIAPGDDWDIALVKAQKASHTTIVLLSDRVESAYYQREEIASAIAYARKDPTSHRVVPIFLSRKAAESEDVPYGLRLKHGLRLSRATNLQDIAESLLALLPSADATSLGSKAGLQRALGEKRRSRQMILIASIGAVALVAALAWWLRLDPATSDTRRRLALQSTQLCQGQSGVIAMRTFAMTVAKDTARLSQFVRANASELANEGGATRCLEALMASADLADTHDLNSAPTDREITESLLRTSGPNAQEAIAFILNAKSESQITGDELRRLVASREHTPEEMREIQIKLQEWKQQNEMEANLLRNLHEMAMTPIRNLR